MKLIAYVSDENYLALEGVQAEFERVDDSEIALLTSSARGAFYGELREGRYRVTMARQGYGAKHAECVLDGGEPHQFRLLSDSLLGYAWPKWVKAGERSELRCHSPEQYQLTLWRYGYNKEYVQTLGWVDEHGPRATVQIAPDGDFTQTGVDWNRTGYPAKSVQQFVTAPERTGLYYVWARTLFGKSFSFPWVVAPRRPGAKIAVLASSNTWNAYNNFGGRSNYINPGGLPETPTVNARQELKRYTSSKIPWCLPDDEYKPLSFDRPEPGNHIFDNAPWSDRSIEDPIEGRIQCGQAPGEWRLLGWMEREGFAYDYYAEAQLDDGTFPLSEYSVLILSVHPEYWTRGMYEKVERWVRDEGGRLIYLGGNGLNCEVALETDGTMRCLSYDDSSDPASGNESRMHRTFRSEAALLGVVFSEVGVMTAAPYAVIEPDHWVFEGTGLKRGELFGKRSLHERVPGGASGHETDKLSASSPVGVEHLAQGTNPNGGGADMVCFALGKGKVFSVGSITWISCLFPDEAVSRITKNVIERFLQ